MADKKPSGDSGSGSEAGAESSSSLPDEVWEQFIRDTESEIRASAPKEPSARARMVTERLRQQDARGELPPGWRTGPAWHETKRRAARRRRVWAVIGVPVALAVALVAMKPSLLPGAPFGFAADDAAAPATPLPPETAQPTAAPSDEDFPGAPTLAQPFAGSPAERYADGAEGIVLPEAEPVGSLTKAQVAFALKQTKKLLVDANLNPATLRGDRPETALGVIEPLQKDLHDLLDTALREPDEDHDPLLMFSRFDPAEVRLVGDVVKTRGRMTFKEGERASVVVHADYTFVYPVTRAEKGSTEVTRTIIRRVLDLELSDPAKYQVTPGKLAVLRYDQEIGNSACDVYDGFLHPQFRSATPNGEAPTGSAVDPYDRSRELGADRDEECGTVTRT
ncbi:hypothetical protein [Streptomyces jeddahensis]|uniref:Uncharacterized protein n=1 Tax=Streptomyces jeddahensis TaxID=1716141 RepID=A0A177I0A4_9ACTN|nr:hypothetical protein STSP_03240 [Streptomyces jeddahensis]